MEKVILTLSKEEALVLFDWLAQRRENDVAQNSGSMTPFTAEDLVLSRIEGELESSLDEVLDPNYAQLLLAAKQAIER